MLARGFSDSALSLVLSLLLQPSPISTPREFSWTIAIAPLHLYPSTTEDPYRAPNQFFYGSLASLNGSKSVKAHTGTGVRSLQTGARLLHAARGFASFVRDGASRLAKYPIAPQTSLGATLRKRARKEVAVCSQSARPTRLPRLARK